MTSPLLAKPCHVFIPTEIEFYKRARKIKSSKLGQDYWKSDFTWVGEPCERLFAGYLKLHNIAYIRWTKEEIKDDRDFSCYGANITLEIDVKTTSGSGPIKPFYTFYVGEDQYNRIMAPDSITNCFVFAYYERITGRATIEGFLSKDEFKAKAIYYRKGDVRGVTTLKSSDYAVRVDQIRPIGEILDLLINCVKLE